MPIVHSKDNLGFFYRWGMHGKKYYYNSNNIASKFQAHNKALRQARAIMYSQSIKR